METKVKVCRKCKIEKWLNEFYKRKDSKDGRGNECKQCRNARIRKHPPKEILPDGLKRCSRCNVVENINRFYKDNRSKDGLCYICKECFNEYRVKNREIIKKKLNKKYLINKYDEEFVARRKEYYQRNSEAIIDKSNKYYNNNKKIIEVKTKEYRKKNRETIIERDRNHRNKIANYSTYAVRLTIEEEPILVGDNELWCRCTHCKEYFPVTNAEIRWRIGALSGVLRGENRLYCSEKCKQECDIFGTVNTPKSLRNAAIQARCNQPVNRQALLDLQIDEFGYNFCDKCGKEFKQSELIIHHNLMVSKYISEADNMSHQLITCEDCHDHKGC
jgi:hypothetical protein